MGFDVFEIIKSFVSAGINKKSLKKSGAFCFMSG